MSEPKFEIRNEKGEVIPGARMEFVPAATRSAEGQLIEVIAEVLQWLKKGSANSDRARFGRKLEAAIGRHNGDAARRDDSTNVEGGVL